MVYIPTMSQIEYAWYSEDKLPKLIKINNNDSNRVHPTQKPKQLFNWCLENYSEPWDIILDCFGGSGTTAVACLETNRQFIVIEKEPKYCEIAEKRVRNTTPPLFTI